MKELYRDIYSWIKDPDDTELNLEPGKKVVISLQVFLLELILAPVFIGVVYFIHFNIVKLQSPFDEDGLFLTLFLAAIIAPVFEELIFRFPLKYQRNYLARFLNSLFGGRIRKRWNSIFKYFLYFMTLSFGLIHLGNYDNDEAIFYILSPVIIGSQLTGGFLLSYIRIKLGFVWSVIQHASFNLVLIVTVVILFHNRNMISISNDPFSMNMDELMFVDKDSSTYSTRYNEDLIYSVEGKNISLFNLIDSLKIEGLRPYDDTWINVSINSEKGVTKNELENILKKEIEFEN